MAKGFAKEDLNTIPASLEVVKKTKKKSKADLKVVDKNAIKTTKYSDINLNKWKDYAHVFTNTLWTFPSRLKEHGHSNDYHGNYIPQVAQQLYERFTKKNDIVLDLFFGSGTSGIEAINMQRRCIGVELKDELAESVSEKFTPKQLVTDVNIICADSTSELAKEKVKARLDIMGEKQAQFLILHPPYDDIIKFSDKKEDLSNCETTEQFYDMFEKVAKNGYDLLEKGRFAALIIGNSYKHSQEIPLAFKCMERMANLGFVLKATIVKDIQGNERAKGRTANLWRYRALAGGYYIFNHEYIFIMQKV
ncbi:MAG: site-specific DNA-methyltransferase [bacterium]|nr:site-specific DNA-methyltransferase [bacterium]